MEDGLRRLGGQDAIQPGFQLLQLGGFDTLAVRLCGFGTEFLIKQAQLAETLAALRRGRSAEIVVRPCFCFCTTSSARPL